MSKNKEVTGGQGPTTTKNAEHENGVSKTENMKAKKQINPVNNVIDHTNIFTNKEDQRKFISDYNALPLSCKNKLIGLCETMSNENKSFKIAQYASKGDEQKYEYYDFTIYHKRAGIKPTRQQIPAIGLVRKLISLFYDTDKKINIDLRKLIDHCNTNLAKPVGRQKKASVKPATSTESTK